MLSARKKFTVANNTDDDLYMSYWGPGPGQNPYCGRCDAKGGQPFKVEKHLRTNVELNYSSPTFLDFSKVSSWPPDAPAARGDVVMHYDDIDAPNTGIEDGGFVEINLPVTPPTPPPGKPPSRSTDAKWFHEAVLVIVICVLSAVLLFWVLMMHRSKHD